jgi:ligand-binding SRPBCC domain-containing protein
MHTFETTLVLPAPVERVFDFFRQPRNRLLLAPPDLNLELVEAPEELGPGARVIVKGRRWGMAHRVGSEVTEWRPGECIVEEQREGPFRRWTHTQRFETVPEGTRLSDRIEFEPPRGMLGLVLTAAAVERDLKAMFAHRGDRLREIFNTGKVS